PVSGWQGLRTDEYDQIWERFSARFQFRASVDPAHWPAIVAPVPSLTWDVSSVDDDGLNRLVMGALQDCVPTDEWVYALDWQHPGYRCWPHRVDPTLRTYMWPVEVFPNGDYYIYASRDLTFGTFGHPWEATLCVWGADLIDAVAARNPGVLT